jgi:hypothetical protein
MTVARRAPETLAGNELEMDTGKTVRGKRAAVY